MADFDLEDELINVFSKSKVAEKKSVEYAAYSADLLALLNQHLTTMDCVTFLEQNDELQDLRQKLSQYQEEITESQSLDRFYSLEGDSVAVRYRKLCKRFLLKTGWALTGLGNIFRKENKEKEFWKHDIPEAALAELVFITRFGEDFLSFYDQLLQNQEIRYRQFYVLDRELEEYQLLNAELVDFDETVLQLKEDLANDRQSIDEFFTSKEEELNALFLSLREKAGTFELPKSKLTAKVIAKHRQRAVNRLDRLLRNQQFVCFALAEHWRLKLQNRSLIFSLEEQSVNQGSILFEQVNETLKPAFIALKKELSVFAGRDLSEWTDRKKVLEIKAFVKQRMPELVQLVFQSKLNNLFERPVQELEQAIANGPVGYQFAAPVFDGKPITRKSFRRVETRELLQGSVLEPLKGDFVADRKKFMGIVQKLTTSLEEIQYSANYSVDFYFSQKKDENAAGELVEGLKRTVKKADENLSFLSAMVELTQESFARLSLTFAERVLQYFEPHRLHQSEKINQRREFIEHRKAQLRDFLKTSSKLSRQYFRKLKELYFALYNRYFNLRNLLGISYETEPITAELSNYLSETRHAIARLPLMYQKLFENVPLKEERFYLARRTEITKLNEAFENWRAGRFSPACIVGEQGSGTTTLLNFFGKSIEKEVPVKRLEISGITIEHEGFLKLFSKLYPAESIKTVDDLIAVIQETEETRMIILENIHKLFLRSSGDFGNLFLLFKLISQTNNKIFWLTTCYQYSWALLNYTNGIAGYFAHVIEFSPMTAEQLREAILKRHQVSGFSLSFMEPENFTPKRNYQKMSDEEKQLHLKNIFFDELWKYAQANLSLAFIYWLRAIRKVEDGEISIQSKRLNFSFLNSLKTREITTLHSILIHGGLGLEQHSRIFRCPAEDSFRMLMVLTDDGLLNKQDELYVVNPLVYRVLVSQLKSLNFIY
ncbi:ATP-binding protein [Mangrovibacterium lignilyticum]|uniref:ATP-binding protein n=1 Tax=Mangrovibacterium lignilyticum TaxID=2668052 RepID=UPI0013D5B83A|nr:ATP-binding protein [Mangrovibacterium lignilyticum]